MTLVNTNRIRGIRIAGIVGRALPKGTKGRHFATHARVVMLQGEAPRIATDALPAITLIAEIVHAVSVAPERGATRATLTKDRVVVQIARVANISRKVANRHASHAAKASTPYQKWGILSVLIVRLASTSLMSSRTVA